ncbi:arabinosyltransferase A/arabinosyltransferase C [Herbihabitans rhizosphaerae]|uniref:Arabinosyltransferase A/arabinosyltransferase C n=1 Tax=Herbihabitans rhizosphaerae TaxID=1872711 RepID=A0A4Q7L773_9PSEU|nr:arabinosyltransferase domain-containing protein [Herbihabitans rhizosphaerae]RZS45136.1 arabinosyltransferase A/arabinosyltransferase C [Herbihabitans rhizosphaerae]
MSVNTAESPRVEPEPKPSQVRGSAPRARLVAAVLALISGLTAILFMLAPVDQDTVTYQWPTAGPQDSALPLFPYRPATLDARVGCAQTAALPGGTLLSTTPPPGSAVHRPTGSGLTVESRGGALAVRIGPATVTVPGCEVHVRSDGGSTTVLAGRNEISRIPAAPVVQGFFTDLPPTADTAGMRITAQTDGRFQSGPTVLKIVLGVVSVLCLIAALLVLRRLDRASTHRVKILTAKVIRPKALDGVVLAALAVWVFIGPLTVDDGYIATMLKSAQDTDFVGNYFRWFNVPEAPFGWFYEVYRLWAEAGYSTPWMRLPSAITGLASWLIIDRMVLPRVTAGSRRAARWTAAGAFLLWYLAYDVGMRPEPWIVLGTLLVFVLTERAIATRAVSTLAVAVIVAGATVAVTPTGIAAVLPLIAALPRIVRKLRNRHDLPVWAWLPIAFAAVASILPFMFYDQTLGTVIEATRVRGEIGPNMSWLQENERYRRLLDPTLTEGALSRRVPVLLTYLAAVFAGFLVLYKRFRGSSSTFGLAAGPTRRLLVATALVPVLLVFTPTKWTHHFGALAGLGTIALAVAVHAMVHGAARHAVAKVALIIVFAFMLAVGVAAPNTWWALSTRNVKWSEETPALAGFSLSMLALAAGGALALAALVLTWRHSRWAPSAGVLVACAVWAVVAIEVASVAYSVVVRRNTFSIGKDSLHALTGSTCGLESTVDVEPDPSVGLLRPAADGWFELPSNVDVRKTPPLVVPTLGGPDARIEVEFGKQNGPTVGTLARVSGPAGTDDGLWRDQRYDPAKHAPAADRVRATVSGGELGRPRLPAVVPLADVVPASERVGLDWPNAFLLPCRTPSQLSGGVIAPTTYRLAAGSDMRGLVGGEADPNNGGPYAPLQGVGTEQVLPAYLRGDAIYEPLQVIRMRYVAPVSGVTVEHGTRRVNGWERGPEITIGG